ncbi:MAG: NAD(P)/FAD-dependent oxidoreductase [Candidatus Baltobacteraceae bacterium]
MRGVAQLIARAGRIDRRTFLTGSGATLAAAVIAQPRLDTFAAQPGRIAIVGAGIAGLTAAMVLHDRGIRATVYESSARVGGRMHSLGGFWEDGQVSEWCAELTDTGHTTIHALCKRFGLHQVDVLAAQPKDAEQTLFFAERYYPWSQAERDFRPVYAELRRQIATLGDTTTYDSATPHARELDAMSLYEWIARYVPNGHRSPMGRFLDLSYVAEYGIDTRKQSALNLVYYVAPQPDYDPKTGDFCVLGASDQRFHIAGGNQQLPILVAGTLPDGALLLRHRLLAIERRSDGRVGLTFATPDGTREELVDKAIVTIPFSVLRRLDLRKAGFDARKMSAIRELGYGEHSKFTLQFKRRHWNGHGAWPGVSTGDITTDLEFLQTWDVSRGQAGPSGLIVQYPAWNASARLKPSAPYTMSLGSAQIVAYADELLKDLERVWPGISRQYNGKAALSHPTYDPNLLGSYSCWLRGQYVKFAGYERVRQGNVLFAGEHCNVALQGFMEGAAREGIRAAHDVLRDLGRRAA